MEPGVYLFNEQTAEVHELHKVFDGINWHWGAAGISGALQSAEMGVKGGDLDLKGPSKAPLRAEILDPKQAMQLDAIVVARKN